MHFSQRIETMKSLNSAEVQTLRKQLDLVRRQANENRSKESEDIQASLRELEAQHNTIEKDLQKQIDDTKEMMNQREKAAQQLVDQVNQQFEEYKEITENQILELKEFCLLFFFVYLSLVSFLLSFVSFAFVFLFV